MDGIPSGLLSVTPILPETSLISETGGVKGPPVEIAPLPDNSFGSDSATAELLNNAFTLSLEIKGYNDGDTGGAKNAGKSGNMPSGRTPADGAASDMVGDAYTLSLGVGDEAQAASEMARELTRMRSYERFGKAVTRQTLWMNQETGPAEQETSPVNGDKTSTQLNETIRNLLSRFAPEQGQFLQQETIQPALSGGAGPEKTMPQQPIQPQAQPQTLVQSRFNSPLAFQLTPSDYEAILTLEPDLQEALLNMLEASDVTAPPRQAANTTLTVQTPPFLSENMADPKAGLPQQNATSPKTGLPLQNVTDQSAGTPMQTVQDALTAIMDKVASAAQAGAQDLRFNPPAARSGPTDAAQTPRTPEVLPGVTAAAVADDDRAAGLISASMAGAAARSASSAGLINLQKITELPYSLYLFGNAGPELRDREDEEEEPVVREKTVSRTYGASEFLKLSDVVKMAAVLHNIYRGGTGLFLEETPWYQPYVKYAVKNGIIKNDEFDDYSEFATKAEAAYIFSGSVPKAEFPIVNYVSDLADVDETTGYGDYIYLLMRAGVLLLSDKKGRFYPESMITRAEAVSLVGRIATPSDRKRF